MSEPRHLNAGKRAWLRLLTRHAGTHRAGEGSESADESLEVCLPALGNHPEIADLSGDIKVLLDAAEENARRRFPRR